MHYLLKKILVLSLQVGVECQSISPSYVTSSHAAFAHFRSNTRLLVAKGGDYDEYDYEEDAQESASNTNSNSTCYEIGFKMTDCLRPTLSETQLLAGDVYQVWLKPSLLLLLLFLRF